MHSHLAKMIGQYIVERRQKLGLLQKDLSESLGISAQFLGRIEKGEVMIPEAVLVQSIKVLELKEDKLLKIYRVAANLEVSDIFSVVLKKKRKRA